MSETIDVIWDIETFPNTVTMCFADTSKRTMKTFEMSDRKDQRKQLIQYLRVLAKGDYRLVGFNSAGFDYPVLHWFLQNQSAPVEEIYDYAMEVIKSEDKFAYSIRPQDMFIPQVDLFKVHHFDNKARMTSLKMLEFNMRSKNIEDLPFPVGKVLTHDEIDVLISYNKQDVLQTFYFWEHSQPHLNFRKELTAKYNKDFTNFNDTKIGKDYFVMRLEQHQKGMCYNKGKPRQTKRNSIALKECVFPYIEFERPEFQALKNWFEAQVITETKGVFTDILESDLGDLAKYATLRKKRQKKLKKPTEAQIRTWQKKHPAGWVSEEELKSGKVSYYWNWNVADALNLVIDGFQYDFGVGGLHGAKAATIIESDDKRVIRTYDVASYYPNLCIKNRIYPEHLGETFCDIYEDVYNQRKALKLAGKDTEQQMMKLALNGTYGASNDKYSPFYDPKFTMSITINGQLSLCMLAEKLLKVPSLEILMVNTDGLEFIVDREHEQQAHDVTVWWENLTKLELEGDTYSKMVIRDVNNYIAVSAKGKIKRKGAYCWKTIHHDPENIELQWHQNHSSPVIAMAAEAHMIKGEDIGDFIRNHTDHMDFMLRTKVPRSSKLILEQDDEFEPEKQLQNICRYYVANNGGSLIKVMPPVHDELEMESYKLETGEIVNTNRKVDIDKYTRWAEKGKCEYLGKQIVKQDDRRIGINTGWLVKTCNNLDDYDGDINYDYYIAETMKLCSFSDMLGEELDSDEENS